MLAVDAFCAIESAANTSTGIQFCHVIDQTKGSAFHSACQQQWAEVCAPDLPPHGGIEPCGFVALVVAEVVAKTVPQPLLLSESELKQLVGTLRDMETMLRLVRAAMVRAVESRRAYVGCTQTSSHPIALGHSGSLVGMAMGDQRLDTKFRSAVFFAQHTGRSSEGHPDAAFRYDETAFSDDPSIVRTWVAEVLTIGVTAVLVTLCSGG